MTELVTKYNEFIEFLKKYVSDEKKKELSKLENLKEEEIIERVINYVNLINEDKKYQNHLLNENKKLFIMNKDIYLTNFPLKNVYKKFSNDIKTSFWEFLQIIYILSNKDNENMDYNIKLLNKLEKSSNEDKVENNREEDDLELNLADKMIRDIAESFDGVKNVSSKDGAINKIIETSQNIGEKYRKDLESGKLNFMDMMSSFQKLAETLDEEDDDDEEKLDSTLMPSPDELLEKMIPGGFEGEQMKSMFKNMENMLSSKDNPLSMMGNLFGMNNKTKEEVDSLTEQQIKELEEYYKEKGINLDELKNTD
jgi:hypothetical protein